MKDILVFPSPNNGDASDRHFSVRRTPTPRMNFRPILYLLLAIASSLFCSGCKHFEYRIVEPANFAQPIGKTNILVAYEPLEYRFVRADDYGIRVANPTYDPVTLLSARSYVVDPACETHPLSGRTMAPHSYIGMTLPPTAKIWSSEYYGPYGLGFGSGFYDPFLFGGHLGYPYLYPYGGYYEPFFYGPPVYYQTVIPYDWEWRVGQVPLKLEYERISKNFVHNFVLKGRHLKQNKKYL